MTTTTVQDTWTSRDLPLLRELVAQADADPRFPVTTRIAATAIVMDHTDAERALRRLRAGEYVVDVPGAPQRAGDGALDKRLDVTEKALLAAGAWPTPETALDRMVAELQRLADDADQNDDTRSGARKVLDGVRSGGRDVVVAALSVALAAQVPGQ